MFHYSLRVIDEPKMSEIRILNLCHKKTILVDSYRQSLLRRREEKVPFSLASYVVNNPILHLIIHIQLRSIPFLNISGDHLPYAAHVGDHLRSRINCDLLGIVCMRSGDHLQLGIICSTEHFFLVR